MYSALHSTAAKSLDEAVLSSGCTRPQSTEVRAKLRYETVTAKEARAYIEESLRHGDGSPSWATRRGDEL